MEIFKSFPVFSAVVGTWAVVNGILHDIFVVKQHEGPYNRDLLRLLMDGHILITCGIMQLISWQLLKDGNVFGYWLCGAACLSLISYVGLIWPFLKSMVTLILNLGLLLLTLISYIKL